MLTVYVQNLRVYLESLLVKELLRCFFCNAYVLSVEEFSHGNLSRDKILENVDVLILPLEYICEHDV